MRWIDDVIRIERELGEVEVLGEHFVQNWGLYKPTEKRTDRMWCVAYNSRFRVQAESEAPMMRKSIVDDTLPYRLDLITKDVFGGGRIINAMLLGVVKYHEACPELVEAALHDDNYEMRSTSVESLGDFKKKSTPYIHQIFKVLTGDKDLYVRTKAVEACAKIGSKAAVFPIRDSLEDVLPRIRYLSAQGYPFWAHDKEKRNQHDWGNLLVTASLEALFKLDEKEGRAALAKCLGDSDPFIRHHARKALSLCDSDWARVHYGKSRIYLAREYSHPQ